MSQQGTIYPCLAYRDPAAAIEFLAAAFGFHKMMEVPGDDGVIVHAEMSMGTAVIMLGSSKPEVEWVSPRDLPGSNMVIYMAIENVDAHHDRAKKAGAVITRELNDTPYGSREYGAKDLEGHQWSFGTYRPEPTA